MVSTPPRPGRESFAYVREWEDQFLALFPHRYDYIWAERPQPGHRAQWKTEKRHPLSDRLIRQGAYLYGVRFGQVTNYLMIDLDAKSPYHPSKDPIASDRLRSALEPLGLLASVACRSSYSGGIHLYFPFETAQNSFQLAQAATLLLERSGFILAPGQLEIFPNPKLYKSEGEPSLFNAHRLPLQEPGSTLLDPDWHLNTDSQTVFVWRWQWAKERNDLTTEAIAQVLKTQRRSYARLTTRASKFLADLDAEIEAGWTGYGQTNHLLGRIALRTYIFHHLINGGSPLSGQTLVETIATTARSLPGYEDWCQHQMELEHRAQEWARSIEASHYYPYGYRTQRPNPDPNPETPTKPNWNQQQAEAAKDRIRQGLADLLNRQALPTGATDRRNALAAYGVSQSTLSKYKDLWHPDHLRPAEETPTEELHPDPSITPSEHQLEPRQDGVLHPDPSNKLYGLAGSPAHYRQSEASPSYEVGGSGGFSTGFHLPLNEFPPIVPSEEFKQQVAANIARSRLQLQAARELKQKAWEENHVNKMLRFLTSADPILVSEGKQWLRFELRSHGLELDADVGEEGMREAIALVLELKGWEVEKTV